MFKKSHYVYAVYKEGSFTKAAEKLYISQPCLSTAIKRLEDELGAKLFERTGTQVKPTVVGLEYIRCAEKIFSVEDDFSAYLKEVGAMQSGGEVRIGAESYVFSHVLLGIVDELSAQYPYLTFSLTEASSTELERLLLSGELDLIVDSYDKELSGFSYRPLRREHILLAVPCEKGEEPDEFSVAPDDIFNGKFNTGNPKSVSVAQFRDRKFILLKSGNSMYDHAMAAFKSAGFMPKIAMLFDQLANSILHAGEMNAVCFTSDTIFKYKKLDEPLKLYRLSECGTRGLGIITPKNKKSTPAAEKFISLLLEKFENEEK